MRSTFAVLLFISLHSPSRSFLHSIPIFRLYLGCFNLFIVYWDLNWLPLLVCCMPCNSIIFRHHVYRPPNYPLRFFSWSHQICNALCDLDSLFFTLQMTFFASYSSHCSSAVELIFHLCVALTPFLSEKHRQQVSWKEKLRGMWSALYRKEMKKNFCTCFSCVRLPKMR